MLSIARISTTLLLLGLFLTPTVRAMPILEFEFLDSGRTYSPTDNVEMRGRITNTGEAGLLGGVGQGSLTIPLATELGNQYIAGFPPGAAPFPPGVIDLAVGEVIEWTIANWVPFPLTGNLGDPVLEGDYVFPLLNISTSIFVPAGPASFTVNVLQTRAADFEWRVLDESTAVSLPASFSLMAFGMLLLGRRRGIGFG